MFLSVVARLALLLLLLQTSIQTNIEYFDTPLAVDAHIFQKCRFLQSGDCCVPVDLLLPQDRRVVFRPFKVVFEYFEKNALYVFAGEGSTTACRGPSVYGYKDPSSQLRVKEFVTRSNQRFTGALFTQGQGSVPVGSIRLPWSITYNNVMYYQSPRDSMFYADIEGRQFLRAAPQFDVKIMVNTSLIDDRSIADS
ncbi:MAG: hypothetical protein LQ346_007526 [Caloplaca aetnensis]|nr:MAG: hypothetical protein LQ346_007526 [Caloplaca aetnensis]